MIGHLAVIDMQRVFAEPDSPWAAPRFAEIVPTVGALVEALAPEVTFTRFVAPAEPTGAWLDYYDQWPFARQPAEAPVWELVEPFGGQPNSIDAPTFSKWGAPLAGRVGAGPLFLVGVSTDCCVLSTAVAAADAGVPVRVVSDACAGADDDSHAKALDLMALYAPLIEIVPSAELLSTQRTAAR
ncbi:MAG TPA: cysteine hydrolase [Pseudonocardia sp.]|nr:cysteine hydrolase [Pseudonocardia sp.]